MTTPEPHPSPIGQPAQRASQRQALPDQLRGLALLGIVLVNMPSTRNWKLLTPAMATNRSAVADPPKEVKADNTPKECPMMVWNLPYRSCR